MHGVPETELCEAAIGNQHSFLHLKLIGISTYRQLPPVPETIGQLLISNLNCGSTGFSLRNIEFLKSEQLLFKHRA